VQADNTQRLLALLVTFSSLYAVALGISSYVSAQDSAKRIEDLRQSIEKSFPFFTRLGERMEQLRDRLVGLMPDSDERVDYYDRLDAMVRENIETVEQSAVSWLYFLDFSGDGKSAELAADICRHLGKYYDARWANFDSELAASAGPPNPSADGDLRRTQKDALANRAKFFLISATEKDPHNFLAWNDLAYFMMDIEGDTSPTAENYLQTSARNQPRQQRAWYNLGFIFITRGRIKLKAGNLQEARTDFEAAEKFSSRAMEYPNWQTQVNPERTRDVIYNRACARDYLGRLAASDPEKEKLAKEIESDLRKVCSAADAKRLELLKDDIKPDGDLFWFDSVRHTAVEELQGLLSAVPQPANASAVPVKSSL
jgi:hypothetical protein